MQQPKFNKQLTFLILGIVLFLCLLVGVAGYLINSMVLQKHPGATATNPTPTSEATKKPVPSGVPAENQKLVLTFKTASFALYGTSYYWSATPVTKNASDINALYQIFGNNKGDLYYILSKDTFFHLEPSSSDSWSLVDDAYIAKNIGTFAKTVDQNDGIPTTQKATCYKGLRKVGIDFFTSIECQESFISKENGEEKILQESIVTKCLYKYAPGKYLMFSQDTVPAGSDKDSCAILETLGFNSVELVK